MDLNYRMAGPEDLELLTRVRVQVLLAANRLPPDTDMSLVERESRVYYTRALADGSHTAILVMLGDEVVGAGGISYYQVMPTYHNPTGRKAYIMNMYTRPEYRRRGIARETLRLLVEDAEKRGVTVISLQATEMGRPLYAASGFIPMEDEMVYAPKEQ